MSEWKNIWKESIAASRLTVIKDPKCKIFFKDLKDKYPDDKMVLFEQAISLDCLQKYNEAFELYEQVSSEQNGLPVKHWREIASFLMERCREKKAKCPRPETLQEILALGFRLNDRDLVYCYQWNSFYFLHSFINLPPHIRYLAISSTTRIDSEPEMSVIIFRACMEEAYKKLHPERPKSRTWLDDFIKDSILLDKYPSELIQKNGNKAIHEGELENSIEDIIVSFMKVMEYCNSEFSRR